MEGGAILRPFEGPGQAPIYRLSALDRLPWPPKSLLLRPPPHRSLRSKSPMLQEWMWKETSQKHLAKMSSRRLSASGLLWALALRPVFLSLAHAQQEHSSEVWFTGRQRLLLWASLNAWST